MQRRIDVARLAEADIPGDATRPGSTINSLGRTRPYPPTATGHQKILVWVLGSLSDQTIDGGFSGEQVTDLCK